MMQTFQTKYQIRINNASPNASSAEELEAVKSLAGQERAPDVLDVGPPFALQAKEEGLVAAYKVSTWDTIPDELKDPDGYWVGDYWGVIAFGANTDVVQNVPTSWADLLKPEYKGQVALNGDPRESGSAFAAVYAAALANGGSLDDITPGIDFFAELANSGNFIAVDATPGSVAKGETPITIDWDYLQIAYGDEFAGQITWQVSVPTDGVFGNYYCQAINKDAPHPFAARLWQEFCYSDEGQLIWLEGYTHPARFQDMSERGVIPQELLDKLPPAQSYENVSFPNADQTEAATAIVQEQWGEKVTGV
jgi:putative spermidine/putrescine transport system substrate-binding protein